jgi:hypothetical protein
MARVERRDGWWGIVEAGMTAGEASADAARGLHASSAGRLGVAIASSDVRTGTG